MDRIDYVDHIDEVERLGGIFNLANIPLTGRDYQFDQLCKHFQNNLLLSSTPNSSKKSWILDCVCSGPGTGKTRGIIEFTKFLRTVKPLFRIEHIFVDFSNGDLKGIRQKSLTPIPSLALLLLNKILAPLMNLAEFLNHKAFEYLNLSKFTLELAIQYIREKLKIDPEQQLVLVVQIDEFQRAISDHDLHTIVSKPEQEHNIWLRDFFIQLMEEIKNLGNTLVFLVPTGVLDIQHYGILPATDFTVKIITMDNLSQQSCLDIVWKRIVSMHKLDIANISKSTIYMVARIVLSVEGLPRAFESLILALDACIAQTGNLNQVDFGALFGTIKGDIAEKYAAAFTYRPGVKQFITFAIAGEPVSKNTVLHRKPAMVTVGDLEATGIVFLKKSLNDSSYIPYIPYIFLCLACSSLRMYDPAMFNLNSIITPDAFELYIRDRIYYNLKAYATKHPNSMVTLNELIPGVMSAATAEVQFNVNLATIGKYSAVNAKCLEKCDFEHTKGLVTVASVPDPIDPLGNVIWIGRNCTVCDVACFLRAGTTKIAILTEQKMTNDSGKLSGSEFDGEYQKAMRFNSGGQYSSQYDVIFALITNEKVAKQKNATKTGEFHFFAKEYEKAVLLHFENMDKFLGPFFKAFVTMQKP